MANSVILFAVLRIKILGFKSGMYFFGEILRYRLIIYSVISSDNDRISNKCKSKLVFSLFRQASYNMSYVLERLMMRCRTISYFNWVWMLSETTILNPENFLSKWNAKTQKDVLMPVFIIKQKAASLSLFV